MLYQFPHKTGQYVVEVIEEKGDQLLVKILAVLKHPRQGDLHSPNEVENVFFHERKALSQFEKRYTTAQFLKAYNEEVPNYIESLKSSIYELEEKMKKKNNAYSDQALKCIEQLKKDYSRQYKVNI
ncbi:MULTISPECIES: sporulation phosphorelay system protein KapB [Mammaliicoccus]|uniref:sporulation phosphorelay system protein KapB n=1 Tax=Mammaliicoccus TaxID=2803850 RepID=UPI000D1CBCF3|nr:MULTISPECIES: sporulation phosphorelay system protein KapB [Mammaliicoccus]HCN61233.1 kinase [Staphylococcus sp.]MBO3063162.1 kinase [Mammaliicoccus fleurettii]MEB6201886.1 kinase-associated lipoprotein B [Mammaliicoccus fleurettii]MEB7779010.1 kinase-associated lipoprotein B [Mammaliicoccus fleurettii]MEB8068410.1 kinase-associated lipoprotein B [Mammaliicoccus fleurettii]